MGGEQITQGPNPSIDPAVELAIQRTAERMGEEIRAAIEKHAASCRIGEIVGDLTVEVWGRPGNNESQGIKAKVDRICSSKRWFRDRLLGPVIAAIIIGAIFAVASHVARGSGPAARPTTRPASTSNTKVIPRGAARGLGDRLAAGLAPRSGPLRRAGVHDGR